MRRALVVGSGSIAKRHIRNLRFLYPALEVVCVSSSGREITTAEVGSNSVRASIDQVLEAPLDFAIVASPATFHLKHVVQLAAENVPILVEKPLCQDLTELEELKLNRLTCKLGVAYNLRHLPAAQKVKAIIESGSLGSISHVQVECGQYLPDWRPGTDYRKSVSAQKRLGGGALLELSHELDYILWLFGKVSSVVAKVKNTGTLDIDVEDSVSALLKCKAGYLIQLQLDFLQRQPRRMLRVVCESGTLEWNLALNSITFDRGQGDKRVLFSDRSYDKNEMYIEQIRCFVAFIKNEADFGSTIGSAAAVMELVSAIKRSSEIDAWMDLEE